MMQYLHHIVILFGVLLWSTSVECSRSDCMNITVPTYWYPPSSDWTQVINASPTVEYVIVNPSSGPGWFDKHSNAKGPSPDPNYANIIAECEDTGIVPLGYVHTSYGQRDPDVVYRF